MEYQELLDYLELNSRKEGIPFARRIIMTELEIIGNPTPFLRQLARKLAKENADCSGWQLGKYYEVDFLRIIVEMSRKNPLAAKYAFLEKILPYVDTWAIIDSACDLKTKDYMAAKPFIDKCLASPHPFMRRFGYIHYLGNFIKKEYLDDIFASLKNDANYYVQMAEAWLLATMFAKYPVETEEYLKDNDLDAVIINKAIQKMRDSYRVDDQAKERIKAYNNK